MTTELQPVTLGFDGITPDAENDPTEYDVQFTPASNSGGDDGGTPKAEQSEEIRLLDEARAKDSHSPTDEEKKLKEQTVYFDDGVTTIDFILTYQDQVPSKKKDKQEDIDEKQEKRRKKREKYIENCKEAGLLIEHQNCTDSPDGKTYYLKVHGTHDAMLKAAEDMLLRMPIRENNLKVSSYRERFFDFIKFRDPFDPMLPRHLQRTSFFSAPFSYERRRNFIGWDDEKNFFTSAQRSSIVHFILLNVRYGEEDDQVGLLRMLANNSLSSGFPIHESAAKLDQGQTDADMSDRQFLYHRWSYPTNWYKRQPLDQIRRYFGEKIGIYFTWLGFYTSWLLPSSAVGFVVFLYGLSRVVNPIADDICDEDLRYDFYMCPRCDGRCDFWYLRDSCSFARLTLIFDNGATVFFAVFMSFWAVLFLEFWKRRQYFLQYDWDVLGFEDSEQRARPEFEQKIKTYIRQCATPEAKKKFIVHNPVLDKQEYIQPQYWYIPKLVGTLSILLSMVAAVIAIVFAVILYRLAVAGLIYQAVSGLPLGPSVGDIIVAITGAALQLVAIIVMNKIYEYLAFRLTNWELHRTQTDYDDSFITKMYFFQFVNFYSSLLYIAFFKGNFVGNPGNYVRIGGLRLDECATYGCLLELTIQLFIIMVGKQILNNAQELAIPYVKRIINCIKHKEEDETAVYSRWERDYDLIPLSQHGLFFEYLELIIQYGFITLFVAALPLAPLFALLNNWIEIRLDAHKFVVVFRRPVPERAGDIGAWYSILAIISQLSVVTNAFLIAFTAQFIPIEVYIRGGVSRDFRASNQSRLSGYVDWSLANFTVDKLLDGEAFPAFSAHELQVYDRDGEVIEVESSVFSSNFAVFVPFVDWDCLVNVNVSALINLTAEERVNLVNATINLEDALMDFNGTNAVPGLGGPDAGDPSNGTYRTLLSQSYRAFFVDRDNANYNIPLRDLIANTGSPSQSPSEPGLCFLNSTTCRFRGFVEDGGFDSSGDSVTIFGARYWQVQTARLAFVVVFEHFIFVIAAFLAWLVPDVPQSVKNEIRREKLLAYEAVHARKEQDLEEGGGDGTNATTTI